MAITETQRSATTTQAFTVTGAPALDIHNAVGKLSVAPGQDGRVSIEITKTASGVSADAAQAALDQITVDVTQAGSTIKVDVHYPKGVSTMSRHVDFAMIVPATTSIAGEIGAGHIDVRGVSGQFTLKTGAGHVTLADAHVADGSIVEAGAGNFALTGALATGASLTVNVGAGAATLTLPRETATHLHAVTGVGQLKVSGWPAIAPRRMLTSVTADGNTADGAQGTLKVHVGTGALTITAK